MAGIQAFFSPPGTQNSRARGPGCRMHRGVIAVPLLASEGRGQLLEAKSNLLRLLQEIPLTEDERSAVDGDLSALDRLVARLVDQPTPSGQTPGQLAAAPATISQPACRIADPEGAGVFAARACVEDCELVP